MRYIIRAVAALGVAVGMSTAAQATTIDFGDYANTYLSSADGVSFSLDGGYAVNGLGTVPFVNAFGDPDQIANSANFGEYPTSEQLIFTFSAPVTGISFFLDNYGGSLSGRGATQFYTYNPSDVEVSTGELGLCCIGGANVSVIGTNIETLILDNGTGDPTGDSDSWLFGVGSLTFSNVSIPEPGTLALLGSGLAGLGGLRFRSRKPRKPG